VPRSISAGHAWRVRSAALTMLTQAATEGKRSAHGSPAYAVRRPHTRTRCYCAGNQPSDMGRRSAHPLTPQSTWLPAQGVLTQQSQRSQGRTICALRNSLQRSRRRSKLDAGGAS
jgi:hypothetical protein